MSENNDARSYARKVAEMREKQAEFFDARRRRPSTVGEAKALEREVDRMTAAILDDRPGLFDRPAVREAARRVVGGPATVNAEGLRLCPNPICRSVEGPTIHHDDYWNQYAGTCSICGTHGAIVSPDDVDDPADQKEAFEAARTRARDHWNALPRGLPSNDEPKGEC